MAGEGADRKRGHSTFLTASPAHGGCHALNRSSQHASTRYDI